MDSTMLNCWIEEFFGDSLNEVVKEGLTLHLWPKIEDALDYKVDRAYDKGYIAGSCILPPYYAE